MQSGYTPIRQAVRLFLYDIGTRDTDLQLMISYEYRETMLRYFVSVYWSILLLVVRNLHKHKKLRKPPRATYKP